MWPGYKVTLEADTQPYFSPKPCSQARESSWSRSGNPTNLVSLVIICTVYTCVCGSQAHDKIHTLFSCRYEEYKAHELLTNFLEKKGFTVERSYTGIQTAFRATFGSGRPNVCVISEYDALPEIGHACGHNLIAEAGVAAGLGLKAALECIGAPEGRVTVMGTPAEEGGVAKGILVDRGAFEDVDLALMVHPSSYSSLICPYLAVATYEVTFTGKAAHAAAFPWEGVNALDAAVMAYNAVSVLRQQMKPTWRVHGIITNGGVKPNIIPEKAVMEYLVRTPKKSELKILMDQVRSCFEAAAKATGCKVEITEPIQAHDNVMSNEVLAKQFGDNWKELGVTDFLQAGGPSGSTDFGNVSHTVPGIHPKYIIGSGKEVNHSREFTAVANTPEAHSQTLTAAKAMAHTCIDVLTSKDLLEKIRAKFQEDLTLA